MENQGSFMSNQQHQQHNFLAEGLILNLFFKFFLGVLFKKVQFFFWLLIYLLLNLLWKKFQVKMNCAKSYGDCVQVH